MSHRPIAGGGIALWILLAGVAAQAAEAVTPARRLCNPDRIRQTNAWVDCLRKAIDTSEAELGALVKRIAATMRTADMLEEPRRGENAALFEASQATWLALRDDDCKALGAHRAGLGFGAVQVRLECLLNETASRVQALRIRYNEDLR